MSASRDTATMTGLNLLSRVTGLIRVVAVAAALGTTSLGDTYQAANLVSNLLFELLAGGVLSAVLVPAFVRRLDADDRHGASALAGALLGRALVLLGIIVAIAMVGSSTIMGVLTTGVEDAALREQQRALGSFLLVFFLPQVLLYAVGAVTTALLQADRRFVAAAVAPVANNVIVVATMVLFRSRVTETTVEIGTGPKLILAVGTTLGVVAMTSFPVLAGARSGLVARPRWATAEPLRALARQGAWAAGHLGINQVIVAMTIVFAAGVEGGVVAFQLAFTVFLLPYALFANPVATALYPRMASHAAAGDRRAVGRDVSTGIRMMSFLVLPATGLVAALAGDALTIVRFGGLDDAGADFVGQVVAGYAVGIWGYAAFLLLTRAAYALDDARSPTIANVVALVVAGVGMAAGSGIADGPVRVASLGVAHGVAVTVAAVSLAIVVQRRVGLPAEWFGPVGRSAAIAAGAALLAWATTTVVHDVADIGARSEAILAVGLGGTVGVLSYGLAQRLFGAPELRQAFQFIQRRR